MSKPGNIHLILKWERENPWMKMSLWLEKVIDKK